MNRRRRHRRRVMIQERLLGEETSEAASEAYLFPLGGEGEGARFPCLGFPCLGFPSLVFSPHNSHEVQPIWAKRACEGYLFDKKICKTMGGKYAVDPETDVTYHSRAPLQLAPVPSASRG